MSEEKEKVVLTLEGEIKFKLEYLEGGAISMDYDNIPLNKMCGMAIARDIFAQRLNIVRRPEVDKKHPAYLTTAQRANIQASINMINDTMGDYAYHLYQEAMEEKEAGEKKEE